MGSNNADFKKQLAITTEKPKQKLYASDEKEQQTYTEHALEVVGGNKSGKRVIATGQLITQIGQSGDYYWVILYDIANGAIKITGEQSINDKSQVGLG